MHTAATAAGAVGALASAGVDLATLPVREATKALSGDSPGSPLSRRCWRGHNRAWIEVRGLSGPGGRELGPVVLDAVRAHPGVTTAQLNYPLSRVVVGIDDVRTSLRDLVRVVADAEKRPRAVADDEAERRPGRAPSLPGDGLELAARAVTLGANAAGLGVALVGRALRLPGLPVSVEAAAVAVDYQPRLRRLLEERLGTAATDTVLTLAMAAAHTVNLAPASLAVDVLMETLKTAEARAEARAWRRHEPALARHAEHPAIDAPARPAPPGPGAVERHAERSAWLQAIGAAVVGAATRNVDMAGTAALVSTPKAARATRESFAATLGRGLADQHAVLPLQPKSLRLLDRVEVVVIDPRVLWDNKLRVVRVRGGGERELAAVWDRAQAQLLANGLQPGWHRVTDHDAEALFQPAHHPWAAAVVAEAHRADVEVVSVDVDGLGELRPTFDDIRPLPNGSIDAALAAAVRSYQRQGHTVAVLSSTAVQALSAADVALGITAADGPPPWCAGLILPDLAAAWRVLHALPAARAASRRGVEISAGASALGALLMLPGVRGRGPGPVTTGAAAGALSGYWLGRQVVNAPAPRPAAVHEWHAMSVDQVRQLLPTPEPQTPVETQHPPVTAAALAAFGVARRGAALTAPPRAATWQFIKAVRAELADPMTPVLALGAAASAVLGSPVDAVLVGSVLGANAVLAAAQRLNAERRLNVLLTQQIPAARKVVSAGVYAEAVAEELRPGDIIEVRSHEVVPADGRLIEAIDLEVDESSLTGESLSVTKQTDATPGADLADRHCMLFAGTTVVAGTAVAVVTAAGGDTHARRAAELVTGDQQAVGLQHQLSLLTKQAWRVSLAGGALVSGLGLLRRTGLRQAVASGIAVSVAAIPEGLPLVATLAQQASARRLTNAGALVRVPRAVEALGRVDVVCFDKTGTLSQNRLRVAQVHPAPRHSREEVLRCAAHATPATAGGRHVHATDTAIAEAALSVNGSGPLPESPAHLPFRSGRPFSASVTGAELTVKGAPEVVLASCGRVNPATRRAVGALAADGLRVIAVARRRLTDQQMRALGDDPEPDAIAELCDDGLSLVGLLGLSDTPRDTAAELLAELQQYEIPIRLITGDHPITATAIARELGLPVTDGQVISGAEWEALSRKDQERAVTERVVFARMSPENKVQIVQTLERTGRVCAMVGDGANDAAAIRAATVGIGVVAHGSDPARTAADVVLLDGRIEALMDALEEGRQLWQRVQAAVSVLLGGNAGEVGFAIVGSAITGRSPLNTRQLLLVNMLTDALPATALAVSSPSGPAPTGVRGPDPAALWRTVAVRGATTAGAAVTAWALASVTGRPRRAATVALVALVSAQLGQTLLDSHDRLVVLTAVGSLGAMATLISIPGVSQLLGCTPLGPVGWTQALGTAAAATAAAAVLPRLVGGPTEQEPVDDADTAPEPTGAAPGAPTNGAGPATNGSVPATVVELRPVATTSSSAADPPLPKGE
ncbi:cation-translocating P-type ATPase [Mycobacterium talmoniae]|uniref:cation-translocating P-type ATPase n=1 Tax=Mycobacterium talmoniae TaxID=1858794 RepID=UPI0009F4BD02|nr:cation-translocating P-type ATPase [Mycobacterium talmoniae]